MDTTIDYRDPKYRRIAFDRYYEFTCVTNDVNPDISVQKWWCNKYDAGWEKRCTIALFCAATGALTEVPFSENFPIIAWNNAPQIIAYFEANKHRLAFSPDCKYRKIYFKEFIESVCKTLEKPTYGTLGNMIGQICHEEPNDAVARYYRLKRECDWVQWGRMGHWDFAECLYSQVGINIMPDSIEFDTGNSAKDKKSIRAGWMFALGMDELKDVTKDDIKQLDVAALNYVKKYDNPRANLYTLETAFCNFKRQFKGSRYGGCYIDEQHTELMRMKKEWPEYDHIWNQYLLGRTHVIPHSMLYELNEHETPEAYIAEWNNIYKDYGRLPRVEAYWNRKPQKWCSVKRLFNESGSLEAFL